MFINPVSAEASGMAAPSASPLRHAFATLHQSGLRRKRQHRFLVNTPARLAAAWLRRVDQGRRHRALMSLNEHMLRDIGLR